MKKNFLKYVSLVLLVAAISSCQKMDRPALGNYPKDANAPGGPLKFYAAFDGSTVDPLRNAVDSIRANFPSDNPFTSATGINGKCVTGVNKTFIKFPSFNDWAASSSFTVSTWFKQNGQTQNNTLGNGPSYLFSLKAVDGYHWSNAVMFLFLEGNNAGCAVKCMTVSPSVPNDPNSSPADNWFTWEGGQVIAGMCDNNWHHMALVYDETTSSMKLYIDGVANPNVKTWSGHGKLNLATTKISEYRIGAGPSTSYASDDWLACTFKGSMDQFRLYGTALTASQITALYTGKQ